MSLPLSTTRRSPAPPACAALDIPPASPCLTFEPASRAATHVRARLVWPHDAPTMSALIATFAHFGLIVVSHEVRPGAPTCDVPHDTHLLVLSASDAIAWDSATGERVAEAFGRLGSARVEVDDFLRLVVAAGLTLHEVVLIRALCRYAFQCGLPVTQAATVDMLAATPALVREVIDLFDARLRPEGVDHSGDDRDVRIADAQARLDATIAAAVTLDADRLFRTLRAIVRATLRTNWFRDGVPDTRALALKLDPRLVAGPPATAPFREVFVHSAVVEGSHLRGGTIARGGLRHSERPGDFRTEVLGLMRTQTVENALIVPVGAKGAFVVRGGDVTPDSVRASYVEFIGALLDVTDNLQGDTVIHPDDTVVTDGPDPYLVVAADKGTARFSDLANEIAVRREYWLGDAFASGGSAGYDHKAMGITARGTWLAVRRHLSEAGIEVATDEFTVVGIGDMSGDVFGNGMLSAATIRLVAAFDHRHVFLDPSPDAQASFLERQRLFHMPASSWDDYDRTLISTGGGVWSRTAKSIPLSDAVRALLGVDDTAMAPDDLIAAILRADVDLLYNGGVGTYVKASTESHAQAQDTANDAVRVNATELRATAIGEGGNLGLTQRARVEFALAGGRVNGDFIDNAAGVATSDREVNLKIALEVAIGDGMLAEADRAAVLSALTDDVAEAVLADCDRQTLALTLAEANSSFLLGRHARLIENLEATTGIDRVAEVLPTAGQLEARGRAGHGLVRPEIAVLLAMSKNLVRDELLASSVPDDPAFAEVLGDHFPASVRELAGSGLHRHRVAAEIVAVTVANDLIDHVGPGFVYRAEERFGASTPEIVRAYALASTLIGVRDEWERIATRTDIGHDVRLAELATVRSAVEQATGWVLRQDWSAGTGGGLDVAGQIDRLAPGVREILAADIDDELLAHAPALSDLAVRVGVDAARLAEAWHRVGHDLHLGAIAASLGSIVTHDHWEALSVAIIADDLADVHLLLAARALADADDMRVSDAVATWSSVNATAVARTRDTLARMLDGRMTGAAGGVAVAEVALLLRRAVTPAR
ncbi:NAD-glutamate dehydrogenase domain-containing protein [Gordonia sp. OPL2]|uniref:NAD-glutamate dehydrogenase domain-containing protein n=1 Tax=Gordonia sp. OPL2 TaxID=2486274 RepID=UPI0016553A9A|nr:NAD-glutamate dehydrogenase domain-containing protein [Gordonia sp. OPL2]